MIMDIVNIKQYYENRIEELEKRKKKYEDYLERLINEPDWKSLYLELKASLVEDCTNCKFRGQNEYTHPCYGCRDNDGFDHFKKM